MDKTNDGGPAFPCTLESFHQGLEGMRLRDYFAARALQGLMAQPDDRVIRDATAEEVETQRTLWAMSDAEHAYRLADAMIAQREKVVTRG